MLMRQYFTKNYEHRYCFQFQGKTYLVHSIVELTEEGRRYLGAKKNQVILTEHFIEHDGKKCWTYTLGYDNRTNILQRVSTDCPPDKLIQRVVEAATEDYASREIFGTQSPVYTTGVKHTKKDWEIPEVRTGWIIVFVVFILSALFKDWYVKLIIRIAVGWIFGLYRQEYVNAYTTYTHEEDKELLTKKFEVLYGIKVNKEDNHE